MERPLALVVGWDTATCEALCRAIGESGLTALSSASGAEIDEQVRQRRARLLFLDTAAPGVDVLELLRQTHRLPRECVLVALLPRPDALRESELIEAGAFDVVSAPLVPAQLHALVHRVVREHELLEAVRSLREDLRRREGYAGLVGRSDFMQRLRERLHELAALSGGVWLHGERGTGKEHAGRALHDLQHGGEGTFVVVPCAGMTVKDWLRTWSDEVGGGAGSPASGDRGCLFLEDLADCALEVQQRIAESLGSRLPGSLRLLASSPSEPLERVASGRLLPDLQRRFGAGTIHMLPLRERAEDVLLLARHFLGLICEINQLAPIRLQPEALQLLETYHWPENVPELRNALEHAAILSADGRIRPRDLPERLRGAGAPVYPQVGPVSAVRRFRDAKREVVDAFERAYLDDLMERYDGNVTAASRQAGMLRSALQRLLRKCGMRSSEFRPKRSREEPRVVSHASPD